LIDYKPYPISTPIQSFVTNVQILVYSSTLAYVSPKELVIPFIYVPFIKNVLEQNVVSFPNSMFFYVGPYTPYFEYGYNKMGSILAMWPPFLIT
jgi:hypothetical protein